MHVTLCAHSGSTCRDGNFPELHERRLVRCSVQVNVSGNGIIVTSVYIHAGTCVAAVRVHLASSGDGVPTCLCSSNCPHEAISTVQYVWNAESSVLVSQSAGHEVHQGVLTIVCSTVFPVHLKTVAYSKPQAQHMPQMVLQGGLSCIP